MKNDHLAFPESANIVKQPTDVPERKISSKSDLDTANLPKYDSDLINSLLDPISVLNFTGSGWWNRPNHEQTIHPTENLISMNLLQKSCLIAWA